MIQDTRVRALNDRPVADDGRYVLYWMQQGQRTRHNHALEHAAELADAQGKPLVVCFGLMDDYPEANARHYAFLLAGLRDVAANLAERGIKSACKRGSPPAVALHYGKQASTIVCDRGYLRHQRRWRDQVAAEAAVRVVQVESDVVVPVEVASDKAEVGARTLRPKIKRHLDAYLIDLPTVRVRHPSLRMKVEGDVDVSDPDAALEKLKLDRSVPPSTAFLGGEVAATKRVAAFVRDKLAGYAERRNEPALAATSGMSGYLHFGQISPLTLALAVRDADAPAADRDAFLEELIVRRELAVNFVHYNADRYDAYDGLPAWARRSLEKHRPDPRPVTYTLGQLEAAETHDRYWNAAQREMVVTGFMQNYLRMYWGKKVIEWTADPAEAYARTAYLNNKYFLCGRDANAWANVGWVFGLHDRGWGPERPVFGVVRYMNAAGLERKLDIEAYVRKVDTIGK